MTLVTNSNAIYPLQTTEVGYLSKTGIAPIAKKTYPIFIPRIMPKMKLDTPKVTVLSSSGALVFKNAPTCKIVVSRVLQSQNYLDVPYERNKSWKGQAKENLDGSFTVTQKTKINVNCKNYLPDGMSFSND